MDLRLLQWEAARRLGIPLSTLASWEQEQATPSVGRLPAVIRFLGYYPWDGGGSFAERLRSARMAAGLTKRALAETLGVDSGTVRKWETGKHRPVKRLEQRIAELLRFSVP